MRRSRLCSPACAAAISGRCRSIVGLVVIWVVFQALNPVFLSSTNIVNLTMQCAAIGTIALGIVLVLLVGEIDLSVGSVVGSGRRDPRGRVRAAAVESRRSPWSPRSPPAPSSGCSTGCCTRGSDCRASSSRWRGCSASSGCSCGCSATTGIDQHPVRLLDRAVRPADGTCPPGRRTSWRCSPPARYAWILMRRARQRAAANLVSQSYLEIGAPQRCPAGVPAAWPPGT